MGTFARVGRCRPLDATTGAAEMIKAGTKLYNPDGSGGYEVTGDIHLMQPLTSSLFKPFGNSPEPEAGKQIPSWLMYALNKRAETEAK